MPQAQSTTSLLFLLILLATCVASRDLSIPDFLTTRSHCPEHKYKHQNVFPRLTWLRDTAIEKIFGLPPGKKKSCNGKEATVHLHSPGPQLPSTLLAKYGGEVVLRFNLSTPSEEQALAEAADTLFLDVWEFTSHWADIRLREDDVPSLLGLLPKSLQKAYSNLMPDLARAIYQSYPSSTFGDTSFTKDRGEPAFTPAMRTGHDVTANLFFEDYQPLSVITPWMRLMASMFSTHVRMINIGTSYEGRDIPALRVGVSRSELPERRERRKTIIISGGLHAREWISLSTVTYITWSLITSYGKSPAITKLLHEFDFVLIPTINPDGYVYTWENDRLWRKNRQQTNLRFCRGLDLDRGFGFGWDGFSIESNPCSEGYPGDEPFQAVESHRLAQWAKNETETHGVDFVGFLDLHSYSQQVLYPFSYTCSEKPPSLENLEELGMGLAKAIRIASGEQYGVASACEGAVPDKTGVKGKPLRMESRGGSAIDWFYHELGVRYSYQIKLRDTGSYGFLLPKENIVPTGEEAFNAVKHFGDFLLGNKGIENHDDIVKGNSGLESKKLESSYMEEQSIDEAHDLEIEDVNWELRRRRRR